MKNKKIVFSLMCVLCFFLFSILSLTAVLIIKSVNEKNHPTTMAADLTGSGSSTDPYIIWNQDGYIDFFTKYYQGGNSKTYVKLGADLYIDQPIYRDYKNIQLWFQKGLSFDGNYKQVTYEAKPDYANYSTAVIGFIPQTNGETTIKNLKITGKITIDDEEYAGGLIGYTHCYADDMDINITIQNCYVGVDIHLNSSFNFAGGLIGYAVNGYQNSYPEGEIKITNTVCCGNFTAADGVRPDFTGIYAYMDYNNTSTYIIEDNSYYSGIYFDYDYSDEEEGVSFSKAFAYYDSNGVIGFVDGDWKNVSFEDGCNYTANPNIAWLYWRNEVRPLSVTYECETTNGESISGASGPPSGDDLWYLSSAKHGSFSFTDGQKVFSMYNFGVVDKTVDLYSYLSKYRYEELRESYGGSQVTVTLIFKGYKTLTFICPENQPVKLGYDEYDNYGETVGNGWLSSGETYSILVPEDSKLTISYWKYNKSDSFYICKFIFYDRYEFEIDVTFYVNEDKKYCIHGFDYAPTGTENYTTSSVTSFTADQDYTFKVTAVLKTYNSNFQ